MKTLMVWLVPFALLMMHAFTPYDESEVEKSEGEKPVKPTAEIYSIHPIEIKENVDVKEFERFVMKELAPIYNKMEGQKLLLVKGDRGIRTNKYAILLTFESMEDRNRIYPPSGGLVGDFGGREIWDKFDSMTTTGLGEAHTDYVVVAH
jgi:hypothetical protein